ncbi:MAG: guanylate kinase [Anaerolineae bacterium]|nr:guanylate kinase [Anaerolineae bacterium]
MDDSVIRDPYDPALHPLLIVISGPSGVGKDSVVERLRERGWPFHFVITATSRPPRPKEVHGKDYFFVSKAEFERMIRDEELLEHAVVYGQHKGIPKRQVREALESGKDVIMRLDVQGASTVKSIVPEAILVFLSASSEEELIERLRRRRTDTEAQVQQRIETTKQEMERLREFDYIIINRDNALDQAVNDVMAIIRSEHCRVRPRHVHV